MNAQPRAGHSSFRSCALGATALTHSICVPVSPSRECSPDQDLQIQPRRPVVDVVEVILDPLLHLLVRLSLAPETVDLRPAGDAGLDIVTTRIERNATLELMI